MSHSLAAPPPVPERLSPRKVVFITETLLLIFTGLICRIPGLSYRIFMSRTIGAEGLDTYSMVYPIFGIYFAVCTGSIQTALSQYVVANRTRGRAVFRTDPAIAVGTPFLLVWGICGNAGFLAKKLLLEPRCTPYLSVMAMSAPSVTPHACINGYCYGMQKAHVPAFSQVAEQVIRIGAVFLIASIRLESGRQITVSLAAYGRLIGGMASTMFTVFCLGFFPPCKDGDPRRVPVIPLSLSATAAPLMTPALPLMENRLILNVLGSAEAVRTPNRLMSSGPTNSEALLVYGVLTSMALPFVLFPSAITSSMAMLLLSTVTEAQTSGNEARTSSMISMSLRYSCYMSMLCIGTFTTFGSQLGVSVFHDQDAGIYITILLWLCPFMHLAITMGNILDGLGRTSSTLFQNVTAMVIRLAFVFFTIPRYGILGYLWGMLVSRLTLVLMSFLAMKRLIPFYWDVINMIAKPVLLLLISIGVYLAFSQTCVQLEGLPLFIMTAVQILFLSFGYIGLLLLFYKKRSPP